MTNIKEKYYQTVDANPDFSALEEKILSNWKKEGIFADSVEGRAGQQDYVFYDGPPFANGLPHYGHLLTGYVKDVFARYQTMRGRHVERRFGWDCHGLPAEMGSEKELGISGRVAITDFGIAKFNEHCRTSVMKYTQEWEYYVTRQARWVDFEGGYKTMDTHYMESVIWAFSELYKKGLAYEAYRVMPYSWAAETPLSNFETRLDNAYREREDKAITVAFELNERPKNAPEAEKYFILAWTTTPWTLPSNLALAVNKNVTYICLMYNKSCYIFAEGEDNVAKFRAILDNSGKDIPYPDYTDGIEYKYNDEIVYKKIRGYELHHLTYKPLFTYFENHKNSFRILHDSFVTDGDGTGIVHLAPGFGEDDQRVCEANGIELVCPVNEAGRFTDAIKDIEGLSLKGMNVLEENVEKYKFGEANERIIKYLDKVKKQLVRQETIKHNYPHCWRTDKPLIYKAVPSWYIEVTQFKERMVELNQHINWIPDNVKNGIFGKWLENARDWSISRNRFWGTPLPIWKSKSGNIKVFGSIAELEKASGQVIKDLHRPYIDEVVIYENGEEFRRVEDVFDCWFESGSMPYAQAHYPFENKDWFETHFPADFIVEYVAQTRGWFYTLMVLSTALFDKPPFLNCICHGVVLDDKKQKLSKRLNNYADPKDLFDTYGADALRWFMMSSPVMRGSELYIDKEGKFIRDVVRLAIKPIWNAYNFFCLYANADGVKGEYDVTSENIMDRYILAKCKIAVEAVQKHLDAYDTPNACEAISAFFEALNNWYIRRSKERFWKETHDTDKQAAYNTLYTVLNIMCGAAAPLLPLVTEEIYTGLTGKKSVHLADFPYVATWQNDADLISQMDTTRDVCNAALAIRSKNNIRVRQPLAFVRIIGSADITLGGNEALKAIIKEEINVKELVGSEHYPLTDFADYSLKIHFPVLGKRLPAKVKEIIPYVKKGEWEKQPDGRIKIAGEILKFDEFTLQLEPKPEYKDNAQALSSNDALVILDTHITPELEAEGYARDLVRLIQQARKDANLDVSDKIQLHLQVSEKLRPAIALHGDYIQSQVLAESLHEGEFTQQPYQTQGEIEGENVTIGFTKATL